MKMACLVLLTAPLSMGGCALLRPAPPAPAAPVYRDASLDELVGKLNGGIEGLSTLKASLNARLTDGKTGKRQSFGGVIALARPGRLRVKASKAMLPTLFDLLCDGPEVTLYVPGDRSVYRGTRRGDAGASLIPDTLVISEILWGRPEPAGTIHVKEVRGPHYVVHSVAQGSGRGRLLRSVHFDRSTLLPARYRYYDAGGHCVRDVSLEDYVARGSGGIAVPGEIFISAPGRGSTLSLLLERVRVNTKLNEGLFNFSVPPGITVKPLESIPR